MAEEVLLKRKGNTLEAADPTSFEVIQGIGYEEYLVATIRRPRRIRHHRLFFALVHKIFENQDRYATEAQLLNAIKIKTGYYDNQNVTIGGMTFQVFIPRSISFAKLDQTGFEQFYRRVIEFVVTEVIPGLDTDDLRNEILELVDGPPTG